MRAGSVPLRELLRRNDPTLRACGCSAPVREWPRNLLTMVSAWFHGRSYANWDGFLDGRSDHG